MNKDLLLKLSTILLAISLPIVTVICYGIHFKSFSKLWETDLQFLFILSNACTSYFFYQTKRWKLSALFLMLVTAFSTTTYPELHNCFAGAFFLSVIYALWNNKRFLYLYLGSGVFAVFGLFAFEWASTYSICFYHLYSLYILNKNYGNK